MQLYSVAQYARMKGISTQAVYKKIHNKKLKTVIEKIDRVRVVVEDTEG